MRNKDEEQKFLDESARAYIQALIQAAAIQGKEPPANIAAKGYKIARETLEARNADRMAQYFAEADNGVQKEIERRFLGCLLIAAEKGEVINTRLKLKADDFRFTYYGVIYKTILKQQSAGTIPDIVTLRKELPDIPASEIYELTNDVFSSFNVGYYKNQICEASKTRRFVKALNTAKEGVDGGADTDTIIKNLISALSGVTNAKNEAETAAMFSAA
jgi:hypothetical protein